MAAITLIVLAFVAGSRVSDTREGLVAEVITLLAGVAGVGLGSYAFFARGHHIATRPMSPRSPIPLQRSGSPRDLALGVGGIGLSIVLLAGLGISGGFLWAGLGFLLLLPMLAGSVYLCWRSLRANS